MLIIEACILLGITFICIFAKDKRFPLYLLIFLLPFNTIIKECFSFFFHGGNIFSYWKECVVLVFFIRNIKLNKTSLIYMLYFSLFFVVITFYLFYSRNWVEGIASYRDLIFPYIIFIAIVSQQYNQRDIIKVVKVFVYSMLIINILGPIQMTLLHDTINLVMSRITEIDELGNIYYKASSFKIMGFERMTSVMEGPNVFGVTNALNLIILWGIKIYQEKYKIKILTKRVLLFMLIISFICLIASFSRAGWVIFFIGFMVLLKLNKISIYQYLTIVIAILLLSFAVCSIYFPNVIYVFTESISGREASVEDRDRDILEGLTRALNTIIGHGLGTADVRNVNKQVFTESSFLNIWYETGIIGITLLAITYMKIFYKTYIYRKYNEISKIAFSITLPSLLICAVTVNCYQNPYLFLWWILMALGSTKKQYENNKQ